MFGWVIDGKKISWAIVFFFFFGPPKCFLPKLRKKPTQNLTTKKPPCVELSHERAPVCDFLPFFFFGFLSFLLLIYVTHLLFIFFFFFSFVLVFFFFFWFILFFPLICFYFILSNKGMIVNLYKLHFSSSHFSSQSNK